jgi:hypothetical protein
MSTADTTQMTSGSAGRTSYSGSGKGRGEAKESLLSNCDRRIDDCCATRGDVARNQRYCGK